MEWFDYTEVELKDKEKQKEVFQEMLMRLERMGDCRYIFHRLAKELFDDDLN